MTTLPEVEYMSGAEAIKKGIITEEDWHKATTDPWTWVVLPSGTRIRERFWRGLEVGRGWQGAK